MNSDAYANEVYLKDGKNKIDFIGDQDTELQIIFALDISYKPNSKVPEFNLLVDKFYYDYTSLWNNVDPFAYKIQNSKIRTFYNLSLFQKFIFNFLIELNKSTNIKSELNIHTIPITSHQIESNSSDAIINGFIPTIFSISYIAILFQFVLWIVT